MEIDSTVVLREGLLELFACVHPGRFCVPTPRGLDVALGLPVPHDHEAEAIALGAMTRALETPPTASINCCFQGVEPSM